MKKSSYKQWRCNAVNESSSSFWPQSCSCSSFFQMMEEKKKSCQINSFMFVSVDKSGGKRKREEGRGTAGIMKRKWSCEGEQAQENTHTHTQTHTQNTVGQVDSQANIIPPLSAGSSFFTPKCVCVCVCVCVRVRERVQSNVRPTTNHFPYWLLTDINEKPWFKLFVFVFFKQPKLPEHYNQLSGRFHSNQVIAEDVEVVSDFLGVPGFSQHSFFCAVHVNTASKYIPNW